MGTILYYFGLYFLVIFIKFAKVIQQYGKGEFSKHWKEIFEISLDLSFTASGCIIALFLNVEKSWVPLIYVASAIILIVSAFINFLGDKLGKAIIYINIIIILLIVFGTWILFKSVIPNVDTSGHNVSNNDTLTVKNYKVILPYKDETLVNILGYSKIRDKYFLYTVDVSNKNEQLAIESAKQIFFLDSTILPLAQTKKNFIKNPIKIDFSKIIVKKIE